jgi:hypothetical protein
MKRTAIGVFVAGLFAVALLPAAAGSPPGASACPVFPSNNVWHADVSKFTAQQTQFVVAGIHECVDHPVAS